jgi:alkaline phosphatase D
MLGEEQWKWLDAELQQPAEVRIIASSVQVIPNEHHWEKWGNMPRERRRLFDLIRKNNAGGVVFISGDRHLAEISRLDAGAEESGVSYPLYDLTSSSLNQPSGGGNENEPNRHRLGDNYLPVNFGTITIDWEQDDPTITLAVHDLQGAAVRKEMVKLSELQP